MPSWMSTVGKMKRSKAELEGDPVEGDGKEDHQSTEKLSDSSDSPI